MLHDILTSYRRLLRGIPLWDGCALMHWLEEVAFWLSRVQDQAAYGKWAFVFASALQTKSGQPLSLCLGILEGQVGKFQREGGVPR